MDKPPGHYGDDNEEIKAYLTSLVRGSIGVENPRAPDPPNIPYDRITREQIHRMSDDQRVRYSLNALRYGTTRYVDESFDATQPNAGDRDRTELRAVAKALLVVDGTLSEFGVPGRLGRVDRLTLEELVREPCNLSVSRERARAVRKGDQGIAQAPRTEKARSPKYALPTWAVPEQHDELNRKVGKGMFDFAVGWLIVFGIFWLVVILMIIGLASG